MVLESEKFKINWQIWCLMRAGFPVRNGLRFCCAHVVEGVRELPVTPFIGVLNPIHRGSSLMTL